MLFDRIAIGIDSCVQSSLHHAFVIGVTLLRNHNLLFTENVVEFHRLHPVDAVCEHAPVITTSSFDHIAGKCALVDTNTFTCIDQCAFYYFQSFDYESQSCVLRWPNVVLMLVSVVVLVMLEGTLAICDTCLLARRRRN
jgi:hypothetical protein